MGFGDAVRTCLTKYVVFEGRAARPEFWWFFLFVWAAEVATYIIADAIGASILYTVVWLGLLLPSLAVGVRRLHDTGRSGWWYLIGLVPIAGIIILIVFWVAEGQSGQNEYGAPPGGNAAMGGSTPPPPPPPSA